MRMIFKDRYGNYIFKIVLYGPALSGKTTMLKALLKQIRLPITGKFRRWGFHPEHGGILFDFCIVPGQKRHRLLRRRILKNVDSIVFGVDSDPNAMEDNIRSIRKYILY